MECITGRGPHYTLLLGRGGGGGKMAGDGKMHLCLDKNPCTGPDSKNEMCTWLLFNSKDNLHLSILRNMCFSLKSACSLMDHGNICTLQSL